MDNNISKNFYLHLIGGDCIDPWSGGSNSKSLNSLYGWFFFFRLVLLFTISRMGVGLWIFQTLISLHNNSACFKTV